MSKCLNANEFNITHNYNANKIFKDEIDDLRKKNVTYICFIFYIDQLHSYTISVNEDPSDYITNLKKIKSMEIYNFVNNMFASHYDRNLSLYNNILASFYIYPDLSKASQFYIYYGSVEYKKPRFIVTA
jgi:hypothetical protein